MASLKFIIWPFSHVFGPLMNRFLFEMFWPNGYFTIGLVVGLNTHVRMNKILDIDVINSDKRPDPLMQINFSRFYTK